MSLQGFVADCLEGLFNMTQALGFPSYAIAIFVIAIIIRLILMPLNTNQLRSTVAMQQIQPQVQELQQRYASNPELMQQKLMQLYQDYNINPLAGCLPMLIQFPIMIALYNGLRQFVPLHQEFYKFLWIPDLGETDSTYIMVVLVAASTFLQSYIITGKPTQPMQKYMLFAMPLMMGWMAASFPSFLCIYWLGVTIVGIVQQLAINKPMRAKLEQRAAELEEEKRQKNEQRSNHKTRGNRGRNEKSANKENKEAEGSGETRDAEKKVSLSKGSEDKAEASDKEQGAGEDAPKKRRRRRR